jgi:hypothetical protein
MELFGKKYTTRQLRQRMGDLDQIAGIRLVTLDEGNERPTRAALFHTGSGLEFSVIIDRCLDVSAASYCGKAMGWRSTVGDVAPQYFEAEGLRWLRSFSGGLVTTCGLTNVGAPRPESALLGNGLHGRIGNLPARDLKVERYWKGNDYILSITGTIRETVVFGENLTLTRKVWTKLGAKKFWIEDVVTNAGFDTTAFMLLYHCNVGWPAADAGSQLLTPSRHVAPRDEEAQDGKENWNRFTGPVHQYKEKVYYHDMAPKKNGTVTVAIINDGFARGDGFGVYLRYKKKHLPRFAQWTQLGEQDYVVGLEPSTCGVEGRDIDEKEGRLHHLRAGEQWHTGLELGAVTDANEVKVIQADCKGVKARIVSRYQDF